MYKILETKSARKDKEKMKSMSKAIKDRFEKIIQSFIENPLAEKFGFEELRYVGLPKLYSVELTQKDRIVYSVENETIIIYQYLGHYSDK